MPTLVRGGLGSQIAVEDGTLLLHAPSHQHRETGIRVSVCKHFGLLIRLWSPMAIAVPPAQSVRMPAGRGIVNAHVANSGN